MDKLGFGKDNAYEQAKKAQKNSAGNIGCFVFAAIPVVVVGCTAVSLSHPGGLNYKGETPEFFIAAWLIVIIVIGGAVLTGIGQHAVDSAKEASNPMSKNFKPTSEAERLQGVALRRKSKAAASGLGDVADVYEIYLKRFNWSKMSGYSKYLYRHLIELEELRETAKHFGAFSDSSLKLSTAPADKRDPIFAGAMADGLFGPAAGIASYAQAVSDNARAEAQAKIDRQMNFDRSVTFSLLGQDALSAANTVGKAIDTFRSSHPIQTTASESMPRFIPVKSTYWDRYINSGMILVDFLAKVDRAASIGGNPAIHDGSYVVVAKNGGQEIGTGFLIGGCKNTSASSVFMRDDPLDKEAIVSDIRSGRASALTGVSIRAKNASAPKLDSAGFRDGSTYNSYIMLKDYDQKGLTFDKLSFEIEPLYTWVIQE